MNGVDPFKTGFAIMPTANPELIRGEDEKADVTKMQEDNYKRIGYSSFVGSAPNEQAVEFGKEIHAEKILLYVQYRNTQSGVMPLTLPNTQTTNTFGMVGSTPISAQTTTYGTQTDYIPYNIDRYDCMATYWVKVKNPPVLGILYDDLSDELKKQIGSNKGIVVNGVIKETPAFNADFLKGDIIKKIDDAEVVDKKMFADLLVKIAGKKVTINILRDGKELNKTVQTNSKPNVP